MDTEPRRLSFAQEIVIGSVVCAGIGLVMRMLQKSLFPGIPDAVVGGVCLGVSLIAANIVTRMINQRISN